MYNDIQAESTDSYINQFYKPQNAFLKALRTYGENRNIPIIRKDTEMLLGAILSFYRPQRILEIGTAFGYSAIFFASILPKAVVRTLEIRETSVAKARKNIARADIAEADYIAKRQYGGMPINQYDGLTAPQSFSSRIKVMHGDAEKLLEDMGKSQNGKEAKPAEKFDMVFMDGPKGHYLSHFKLVLPLLAENALIISDNILLGGMTSGKATVSRRNLTMTRRMDEYLQYITRLGGYSTSVIPMGDGVALTWKSAAGDKL